MARHHVGSSQNKIPLLMSEYIIRWQYLLLVSEYIIHWQFLLLMSEYIIRWQYLLLVIEYNSLAILIAGG